MQADPKVDLTDPAVQVAPYEAYRTLREHGIYRLPSNGMYIVTRYADIAEIERRPEDFSSDKAAHATAHHLSNDAFLAVLKRRGYENASTFTTGPVFDNDPPRHTTYRNLVNPFFTPSSLKQFEPFIAAQVNSLIDAFDTRGRCEFVGAFGFPLPARVIVNMLGLPQEELPRIKYYAEAWLRPFAMGLSDAERTAAAEVICDFYDYIAYWCDRKRTAPDSGLMSALVHARYVPDDGPPRPLNRDELTGYLEASIVGGYETTANALSSGVMLYIANPRQAELLRAAPDRVRNFTEEVLRLESPTQGLFRVATRDIDFHGTKIPKGAVLNLRFAAANRDERQFPDPEKLDLGRRNAGQHVAFGQYIHHCLGASLARLELTIAFRTLFQRLRDIHLDPDMPAPAHVPGYTLRALSTLHIAFEPASRGSS
jgi:cytochrome P450